MGSVDQVGAVDFGHVEVFGAGELDIVLAKDRKTTVPGRTGC